MQPATQRSSHNPPGFLPLPRLTSDGWRTPTAASTAASSPWDDGTRNPFAEMSSTHTMRPYIQPLRLPFLQRRGGSASSTTVNAPESPRPLSPLTPRRFNRPEGSALGIIIPPGTPPADALPRWLVDRRSSRQRSLLSGTRTPPRRDSQSPFEPAFHLASPAVSDWQDERRQLVRTPEAMFEGSRSSSRDDFPFDIGMVSGERIQAPAKPRPRPLPLPRCSSDDLSDRRLFRVNAWGEHNSPNDATGGLYSLMQGQSRRDQSRPRNWPPSRLASTAPSPVPSLPPE